MLKRPNFIDAGKSFPDSVTIVVCAYTSDRWATLQRGVDMARKQMGSDDELIVVVDHNDSLLAWCSNLLLIAWSFPIAVAAGYRERETQLFTWPADRL